MTTRKAPVLEAVRAAVETAKTNAPRASGALALNAAVSIAVQLLGLNGGALFGLSVAGLLASVVANGALYRLAFADEHPDDPEFRPGPLGLQWGRPEFRILGAMLLLFLLLFLGFLLWFVLAIVVAAATLVATGGAPATPDAAPPAARAAAALLGLVFVVAALWVLIRICTYQAASVAEKRVQVFSTWTLTRGQFWRILAAIILVSLPMLVAGLIAETFRMTIATTVVGAVLVGAVNGFVQIPLFNGLSAYLYRVLRPGNPGLAGPFASV